MDNRISLDAGQTEAGQQSAAPIIKIEKYANDVSLLSQDGPESKKSEWLITPRTCSPIYHP